MESSKNNDNNKKNGEGEQNQQLRRSAQKRKLSELTNDEDKPAAEEDKPEPKDCSSSKKNREEGNDLDLELESLSREELIKLVQTQMGMTIEAQKQLEGAKKEADEKRANAKQQQAANREIALKMEEFKRALLASQQKVQELTEEMAKLNSEYQILLEHQIVQLPHEKEEGIEETEKQAEVPTHLPIKIQLAKETWFCLLTFVPRHQLGQIVPQIGDRQFAKIAQSFLHDEVDNKITLGKILIHTPCDWDADGRPRLNLHVWPKFAKSNEPWRTISRYLTLPEVPMPENIKDFLFLCIGYLDSDVLNFLRQFHQNSLFENVNLNLQVNNEKDTLLTTLSYVLPLIRDNITSIRLWYFVQLRDFYNANSEMAIDMLKMPRILELCVENYQFGSEKIHLLNRWLYTPRDDGKPRVLILPSDTHPSSNVLHFIDNIKMEFSNAKTSCSFFIRLFVRTSVELYDISMETGETKEKLVIKNVDSHKVALESYELEQKMALISRYPLDAGKKWVEANEREALDWDFCNQNRTISMDNPIKNAIPHNFEHSLEGREAHYRNIRLCDCSSSTNDGRENQGGSRDNHGDQMETFAALAVANDQQEEKKKAAEKEKDYKDEGEVVARG